MAILTNIKQNAKLGVVLAGAALLSNCGPDADATKDIQNAKAKQAQATQLVSKADSGKRVFYKAMIENGDSSLSDAMRNASFKGWGMTYFGDPASHNDLQVLAISQAWDAQASYDSVLRDSAKLKN